MACGPVRPRSRSYSSEPESRIFDLGKLVGLLVAIQELHHTPSQFPRQARHGFHTASRFSSPLEESFSRYSWLERYLVGYSPEQLEALESFRARVVPSCGATPRN